MCVLLAGFMGSGTTECQIIYGTDDSYSNLPFMDTGNNTSTTITVALSATLQPRTTYYYIVTATSENVCARQQGSFTTGTLYFCILHNQVGCDSYSSYCMIQYYVCIRFHALCACVYVWGGGGNFLSPSLSPSPPLISQSLLLKPQIERSLQSLVTSSNERVKFSILQSVCLMVLLKKAAVLILWMKAVAPVTQGC